MKMLKKIKKYNEKYAQGDESKMPYAYNCNPLYRTLVINGHVINDNYLGIVTFESGTDELQWLGTGNKLMGQVVSTNKLSDAIKLYGVFTDEK